MKVQKQWKKANFDDSHDKWGILENAEAFINIMRGTSLATQISGLLSLLCWEEVMKKYWNLKPDQIGSWEQSEAYSKSEHSLTFRFVGKPYKNKEVSLHFKKGSSCQCVM